MIDSAWLHPASIICRCFNPAPLQLYSRAVLRSPRGLVGPLSLSLPSAFPEFPRTHQPPSLILSTVQYKVLRTAPTLPSLRQHSHSIAPVAARLVLSSSPPRRKPTLIRSFRNRFVPIRRANVTRLPRILQANRVVAHASYLSSFKPFHTHHFHPSKAPSPAAQAATTRTRFNSGLALVHSLFPTP
jgi:hypothetical protein